MFPWLKERRDISEAHKGLSAAQFAITQLGVLIEQYPDAIIDEKRLPLPKSEIKTALKIGWVTAKDDETREWMKVGWVLLSFFQPGVGDQPISAKLPPNPSPEEVMKILGPYLYLELSPRVEVEMSANSNEFEAFVQAQM